MNKAQEKAINDALNALSPYLNQVTRELKFWEQQQSLMQASRDAISDSYEIEITIESTSIREMRRVLRKCFLLGKLLQDESTRAEVCNQYGCTAQATHYGKSTSIRLYCDEHDAGTTIYTFPI